MLLSALLTWLWPNQVSAQSILLFVVQAAPHMCSVPLAPVSQCGMTCVPITRNAQQENSTGQTSCAASAVGNTPKNVLSTSLQDRKVPGWAGSWGDTASGNWLKAFLMSALLHFYWDTQWKKMVIILLKNSGCLFLLSRNGWLVHQHCVCPCQRSDAKGFNIFKGIFLTLSLWTLAVAFFVPLVLQALLSFAVLLWILQRGRKRTFSCKLGRNKAGKRP